MIDYSKYQTGSVPKIKITKETAEQILSEKGLFFQRPRSKQKVAEHKYLMQTGQFGDWGILQFAQLPDGSTYLISGQHRLTAIAETGIEQEFIVVTTPVEDMDDIRLIYGYVDKNKPKTRGDAARALGIFDSNIKLFTTAESKLLAAADVITRNIWPLDKNKKYYTVKEVVQIIRDKKYDKAFIKIYDIFKHARKEMRNIFLGRSSITACSLLILTGENNLEALEFLQSLAKENAELDTPAHTFKEFLLSVKASGGASGGMESHGISKTLHIKAFAIAWQHYLAKKKLPLKKFTLDIIKEHGAINFEGNII
jgi:hypothetical protein